MNCGRVSHSRISRQKGSQDTPGDSELVDGIVLFIQDLFRFNRMNKIAAIIIATMVIVGHVWLGCK